MKREIPNQVKSTKKERRKKFSYFKDALHRNFGSKAVSGMGEKKPLYCSICKQKIYIARYIWIGDIHYCLCDSCLPSEAKLREDAKKKKEIL